MVKTISLAITTYNRSDLLFKCFDQVENDERISQIVIVDDCSDIPIYKLIQDRYWKHPKVTLLRNSRNLGVYFNKKRAIEMCRNEWCIIFDSDNILTKDYIDKIYSLQWDDNTIYAPDWAMHDFNYTSFAGIVITKENINRYLHKGTFDALLNTQNYFVHRENYLNAFDGEIEPLASDSIYFNYCHLKLGGKLLVVPNLRYIHRVHDGSNYVKFAAQSEGLMNDVYKKIKQLR